MQKKWISVLVLAVVAAILAGLYAAAHPGQEPAPETAEYMEYENAVVEQILSDSTEADPVSEDHFRGNQSLILRVKTGQYAGQQMMADNTVGPIYGSPLAVGDRVTVGLSTYADGTVRCYVYEYNRFPGLLLVLAAFLIVTVLVGGKVGLKSLVSLGLTVAALIFNRNTAFQDTDTLRIVPSDKKLKIVRIDPPDFYEALRRKSQERRRKLTHEI